MARSCTVCGHPSREAIDRALVGGAAIAALSREWLLSEDALARHRDAHLPKLLRAAHAEAEAGRALDVVAQLRAINQDSLAILRAARAQGEHELALRAIDRLLRQVELQAKLLGDLDERPQINVVASPEWLAVRAALLEALAPYPEARVAVAARLARLEAS